jgi:hypothetical protein
MKKFDLKAAGWDENPIVWERAEVIVETWLRKYKPTSLLCY